MRASRPRLRRTGWRRVQVAGKRSKRGRLERAVRRDIRDAGRLPSGARSLAEIAVILAQAIDEPGGNLATKAKLAQELRVTLAQLREVVRDSVDGGEQAGESGTPVWDSAQPGAADVGAAGGGGGPPAG